jgi:hypothetical protein
MVAAAAASDMSVRAHSPVIPFRGTGFLIVRGKQFGAMPTTLTTGWRSEPCFG